jgi:AmmeMemoRadiSam system protein B/AmmeMemoRadiSam system protein A
MRWICGGLAALFVALCPAGAARAQSGKVRPAAVAGSFYPAEPEELGRMIDGFLAKAKPPAPGEPIGLVAPHAGYVYAGPVAGYAYQCVKGKNYERVVVIAPSHYDAFGFSSVYDGDAYTTPFGQVPVDKAFAKKLAGMSPLIKLSSAGHTATRDRPEHSLEVELPYLQRAIGSFMLVPVIMGDQSYEHSRALGAAIAKLTQGTSTLIVASSDLSHYHKYEEAVRLDTATLNAVKDWDYLSMSRNFESRIWEACGGGPIVAAMIAAERLGAQQRARVLRYQNSGDTAGDRGRVVGYGAVEFVKAAAGAGVKEESFALTRAEKNELLRIARRSVETAVRDRKKYESAAGEFDALGRDRGAFVTLKERGALRGCIGYVAPVAPLYATVRDVAMMAALRDTRFRPVNAGELGQLEYEVSVLSPLVRVRDVKEIRVGRDGLLIRKGGREGLLLPQVPVEEHWDRGAFLREVCLKAGLPGNAWQDPESDLFRFTALVFGTGGLPEPEMPELTERR